MHLFDAEAGDDLHFEKKKNYIDQSLHHIPLSGCNEAFQRFSF
jgi:hypothetical protein